MEDFITIGHNGLSVEVSPGLETVGKALLAAGFKPGLIEISDSRGINEIIVQFRQSKDIETLVDLLFNFGDDKLRQLMVDPINEESAVFTSSSIVRNGDKNVFVVYLLCFSFSSKSLILSALNKATSVIDKSIHENGKLVVSSVFGLNDAGVKLNPVVPGISTINVGSVVRVTMIDNHMKNVTESVWLTVESMEMPIIFGRINHDSNIAKNIKSGDIIQFHIFSVVQVLGFPKITDVVNADFKKQVDKTLN